jgi:hypothetical protein
LDQTSDKRLRTERLIVRYQLETKSECLWTEDQPMFLAWLCEISTVVKGATFKSYRKWLAQYAEELGYSEFAGAIRLVGAGERGRPRKALESDSLVAPKDKARRLTREGFSRLSEILVSSRGKGQRYEYGIETLTWLSASMMTGLRPGEWSKAQLYTMMPCDDGATYDWILEIEGTAKGAKSSQLKGSGNQRRRLMLGNFKAKELDVVTAIYNMVSIGDEAYQRLHESVRQTLIAASKQVFGDSSFVTLNTGRHVFASEIRRQQESTQYALAALLGHSDTINQKYYGDTRPLETDKRRFSFSLAKPWPGSAAAVEAVDRERYRLRYGTETAKMMEASGEINFKEW